MRKAGPVLEGALLAVLAADGFDLLQWETLDWELTRAGVKFHLLAAVPGQMSAGVRGLSPDLQCSQPVQPDRLVFDSNPSEYDALVILGGPVSADQLRGSQFHLAFIRNFMNEEKPILAVGHGCWLLADAGALFSGKAVAGPASIRHDLEKAGGVWKSDSHFRDGNLWTTANASGINELLEAMFPRVSASVLHKREAVALNAERLPRASGDRSG